MFIIHVITGVYTGSLYKDGALQKQFPAEGKRDGSVIAVKIHETNKITNGMRYPACVTYFKMLYLVELNGLINSGQENSGEIKP